MFFSVIECMLNHRVFLNVLSGIYKSVVKPVKGLNQLYQSFDQCLLVRYSVISRQEVREYITISVQADNGQVKTSWYVAVSKNYDSMLPRLRRGYEISAGRPGTSAMWKSLVRPPSATITSKKFARLATRFVSYYRCAFLGPSAGIRRTQLKIALMSI